MELLFDVLKGRSRFPKLLAILLFDLIIYVLGLIIVEKFFHSGEGQASQSSIYLYSIYCAGFILAHTLTMTGKDSIRNLTLANGIKPLLTIVIVNGSIFTLLKLNRSENFSEYTLVAQSILVFSMIISSRIIYQSTLSYFKIIKNKNLNRRVMIFGAGDAGQKLARLLSESETYYFIGYFDDNKRIQGVSFNGKRVFKPNSMLKIVEKYKVSDLYIAVNGISQKRKLEIFENLKGKVETINILPNILNIVEEKLNTETFKPISLEDILEREHVPPNSKLLQKNIFDKNVLVTGAGGSIGSELCRQILAYKPARLVILDNHEYSLYKIQNELEDTLLHSNDENSTELVSILGSVIDVDQLKRLFNLLKPHTVYHAAAYKHVPIVESNIAASVYNNIVGTLNVVESATNSGTETFVLISTDKAVRPTNIMGATKRVAEQIVQSLQQQASSGSNTKLSMVRFGNVLGSSGSVVPLFKKQIASGKPLTVTHPDVTRYFMTVTEASQLVIQAGALSVGGEVFVLDMGNQLKILDIAQKMLKLANREDLGVEFIGLRKGEKLYEEMHLGSFLRSTKHSKITVSQDDFIEWPELKSKIGQLINSLKYDDEKVTRKILKDIVPEFSDQP